MKKVKNNEATNRLIDSINKSGRPFKDIPVSAIELFLKDMKVPETDWKSIYEDVFETFNPKTPKEVVTQSITKEVDIKERVPRKSVFGKISKI